MICSYEGCVKPQHARTLCNTHYMSEFRKGNLDFYPKTRHENEWSDDPKERRRIAKKSWIDRNPESVKRHDRDKILRRHHVEPGVYDEQVLIRQNCCDICKFPTEKLVLDHDHKCCTEKFSRCGMCIRGLLCGSCNRAIGLFKDNIMSLKIAIKYLEGNDSWLM